MSDTLADRLADRLAELLRARWGSPVRVTDPRPLPGGASRQTWSCDARTADGGTVRLIIRRDPDELPRPAPMAREAAAFTAARAAGVPVPELYDHGERALGSPYLLMERLDGETIPRRLLRDDAYAPARAGLARELGRVLARVHAIDPAHIPGLERVDALPTLWELYTEFDEPRPAIEIGLRWLAEHRPAARDDTVVHGDFRTGNLLIAPDGLRGVLDWELVHRGDPMADLGWLCTKAWRFGSPQPVGGFGSREQLLAGYAAAGGDPPDAATLHWWEVHGTLRWALLCRRQAERHLSGAEPSVELAVLGRRVCEQEYDVLLALGLAEPRAVPAPPGAAGPGRPPHDRPTADELLDAVHDFLSGAMRDATDPQLRFHARVAANAVRIARREALLGDAHARAHAERLAALGCADDALLCRAIRHGSLDDRFDDVVDAVRATVVDKLTVANPAHLAQPA